MLNFLLHNFKRTKLVKSNQSSKPKNAFVLLSSQKVDLEIKMLGGTGVLRAFLERMFGLLCFVESELVCFEVADELCVTSDFGLSHVVVDCGCAIEFAVALSV